MIREKGPFHFQQHQCQRPTTTSEQTVAHSLEDVPIFAVPLQPLRVLIKSKSIHRNAVTNFLVDVIGHCLVQVAHPEALHRRSRKLRSSFDIEVRKAKYEYKGQKSNTTSNLQQRQGREYTP